MNSEKQENSDGETSRLTEESSSTSASNQATESTAAAAALALATASASETLQPEPEKPELAEASSSSSRLSPPPPSIGDSELIDLRNRSVRDSTTQTSPKNQASTSSEGTSSSSGNSAGDTDEMKRAAARKLIERYFYQLLDGCGNPKCSNKYCASSGEVEQMTPNQAAARAIQLFSQDAKLCDAQPAKIAKTTQVDLPSDKETTTDTATTTTSPHLSHHSKTTSSSSASATDYDDSSTSSRSTPTSSSDRTASYSIHPSSSVLSSKKTSYSAKQKERSVYLDETKILEILEICSEEKSYAELIRSIGEVFLCADALSKSFRRQPSATIDDMLQKAPSDLKSMKKEDLRTLEGDLDKDEDSSADKEEILPLHHTTVDLPSLRRTLPKLFKLVPSIYELLNNALKPMAAALSIDLRINKKAEDIEKNLHVVVLVFELISTAPSEFLEEALPDVCKAASHLPVWAQARLAWIWAEHCKLNLRNLLQTLQQLISLKVISENFTRDSAIQDNLVITCTTKVLKIVYYANILAGKLESPKLREEESADTSLPSILEEDSLFNYTSSKQSRPSCLEDKLSIELGVSVLDCRIPLLPFEEFYNEPLSDAIEMDSDYLNYKNLSSETAREGNKFSFMLYSFILTPATKIIALYYDSRIRMYSERRISIFQTQLGGQSPNPYLKLKVRREQIIDDALVELEMVAMGNPKDLKKQLVVEFVGEQGIDEGGVSKEFFQLIVEQIFNPDYGMFIYQEDTKTVWFNSTSFENEAQFTLIGIVLGLAIYNNIILAVNFPMVVYRKLMGVKGSFYDLADWNPVLFKSLQSMLDYEDADMEDVFMQTFKISYTDVFGNTLDHELKPNGGDIFVTQDNKHEFVELYTDFLLNSSIEKQFRAFRKGFQMVTDESPLQLLFRPEEIELLVCGSKHFDFVELEKSTEYEGGYTEKSQIIIDFWSIVHGLPDESKRKLLEFTTGSDRVPVGGLSRLKLVIARNGPDSDRLPTSHTCFNVLLLPEYASREKLEDRLLKAINYSKGFGML
ncbi:unnamed protein product [Hermetia illucens]|uniref:Ubiquitin-protein ligase E3A n=1 Tax=Hermetia illucens TaxID=343691 RepID=A0A7R8YPX9_HERIL|nr:ubiquitin-protein ligase E3A isoform X2 [Hermetia illucens]CAD7081216.1 unnamed protein product [Hermetia illucens]